MGITAVALLSGALTTAYIPECTGQDSLAPLQSARVRNFAAVTSLAAKAVCLPR